MAEPDAIDVRQALDLPPAEMLRYLEGKGYRTSVGWSEIWQDGHVRDFTVAKMAQRDLLELMRGSIHEAWAKGVPLDRWKAGIVPELQKAGWWGTIQNPALTGTDRPVTINPRRLENIYRTNFRTAAAAAEWKLFQAAKQYAPYLRYRTRGDERVRLSHKLLNDIILPVDHPFWLTYLPPNDWGCRCRVVQLSQRDLDRRKLKVTTEAELAAIMERGRAQLFWRRGARRPEVIPPFVGPGWGYNPGVSYLRALEPPALDAPLAVPNRAARGPDGPLLPLPPARALPADMLLPPDTAVEAAIARFVDSFRPVSEAAGDALLFRDKLGEPLVISARFFTRADGSPKMDGLRRQTVLLLAEAIRNPDEIWWQWERVLTNRAGATSRFRLSRRYVAHFTIEGRPTPVIAVMEVSKEGWHGVTAFVARVEAYIGREQVRGGVLAYRRAE
jgi:SPP1 gp7 family putative phage head morphogenesis protein